MNTSETIAELASALNKAQSEMSGAKKTAKNPFFKSNYANLEEVIHCIKEPFADNGLSFMQFPITTDGFAGVETIILHSSGEWVSNEFMLKCSKNDPQGMGSAITYARRYGLQSACGIPSEDDDGNAATSKPAAKAAPAKPITAPQKDNLITLKGQAELTDERFQSGLDKVAGKEGATVDTLTQPQAATDRLHPGRLWMEYDLPADPLHAGGQRAFQWTARYSHPWTRPEAPVGLHLQLGKEFGCG